VERELSWWSRGDKTPGIGSSAWQSAKSSGNQRLMQVSFDDEDDVILISHRRRLDSQTAMTKNVSASTQTTPRERGWSLPGPCCSVVIDRSSHGSSAPRPRRREAPNSARSTSRSTNSEEGCHSPYLPLAIPEVYDMEWNPEDFLAKDERLGDQEPWQNQMKASV